MTELTLQDYKQRILRVLVHIQQHLGERLPLDELAGIACFSPYHFHRIFTGMVGESVKEHVRRLRLERAAGALKLGSASVTRIALDAGYDSHEAFTRSFKAAFGVSPSQFRSRTRPGPRPAPSGVHYRAGEPPRHFRSVRHGGAMKVEIRQVPPRRVAFVRHVGRYSEVGAAWDRLLPLLGSEGRLASDSTFIGICHDDPQITPEARIRYDACVTVGEDFLPRGDVGVQEVPGGAYAVATHAGPYDTLGRTYAALLGEWLPRSGRVLRDSPGFEVYLNDPHGTEPADLLVDVYVPLEPAGRRRARS